MVDILRVGTDIVKPLHTCWPRATAGPSLGLASDAPHLLPALLLFLPIDIELLRISAVWVRLDTVAPAAPCHPEVFDLLL